MIKQVLVTRPAKQAVGLMDALSNHGFTPLLLPAMIIKQNVDHASFKQAITQFPHVDQVIFVSVNAVTNSKALWPWLQNQSQIKVLAIGPATAAALQQQHIKVDVIAEPANSEALLKEPLLNNGIANQSIIIVCGKDPKPLLANTLIKRGVQVFNALCYERQCPAPISDQAFQQLVDVNHPIITIITSNNVLTNLLKVVPKAYHHYLFANTLIVIKDSLIDMGKQLGFKHIWLAKSASTADLLACIQENLKIS